MRPIIIIYINLILISCGSKKTPALHQDIKWTDQQKQEYFNDSISYNPDLDDKAFQRFFKKHYPEIKARNTDDPYPYAFEEPYIDTTQIDSPTRWFRVIVYKEFTLPYAFIVQRNKAKNILITKVTDGNGPYYPGTLALTLKTPLKDSLAQQLFHTLDSINFWKLPRYVNGHLFIHPQQWTIEAINNGKYNLIHRLQPGNSDDNGIKSLYNVVMKINEESRLRKILAVLGNENGG